VGPSNDHELSIARIVDQIDIDGWLDPSVVDEIIAALGFIPSDADKNFLVGYIRWRMANPIVK
jgi:hypothetical protein